MRESFIRAAAAAVILLAACPASAANVMQNVYSRDITSLNGTWRRIVDPFDNGFYDYRMKESATGFFLNQKPSSPSDLVEYDFSTSPVITVPGDWNTQEEQLFLYEGSVWYFHEFSFTGTPGRRTHIYFGAVCYTADVYLNGEKIGFHEGGFTPFSIDVTGKLRDGNNFLILRVNNRRRAEGVPTLNFDWWNYGGITRDVLLVSTPEVFVDDYLIGLDPNRKGHISGYVQLSGDVSGRVSLRIPELGVDTSLMTDASGRAEFSVKASPELWSPDSPRLYGTEIAYGGETLRDRIGFRTISARGQELLLNGEKIFLRGICIHEEAPFRQGRAYTEEDARTLLGWAKELGCNFVRLAHYPHNEHMVRIAEEMGLMVWSEIPVYWTIAWSNPDTYANASAQLGDMISRDRNRCSVIIWSVANETPHSPERDSFLIGLIRQAREADPTRLVSLAMEVTTTPDGTSHVDDTLHDWVDVVSFNSYLGWYGGSPADCLTRVWDIPQDKPFIISECGGGALYGRHGADDERWTEEYQALLYRNTAEMFNRQSGFSGLAPWILMDFRSTRRQLAGIQDFFNRKGVISQNGQRKQAFYVLRDFYARKAAEQAGK